MWNDLNELPESPADVMAVNDMIIHYPYKLKHAYSLNKDMLDKWVAVRGEQVRKHCPKTTKRRGHVKSSGINAIYCGLDLGYDQIVVCGVPLDNAGHYFDPPWIKTAFDRNAGHLHKFGESVYFMSGRASGERPDWLL